MDCFILLKVLPDLLQSQYHVWDCLQTLLVALISSFFSLLKSHKLMEACCYLVFMIVDHLFHYLPKSRSNRRSFDLSMSNTQPNGLSWFPYDGNRLRRWHDQVKLEMSDFSWRIVMVAMNCPPVWKIYSTLDLGKSWHKVNGDLVRRFMLVNIAFWLASLAMHDNLTVSSHHSCNPLRPIYFSVWSQQSISDFWYVSGLATLEGSE